MLGGMLLAVLTYYPIYQTMWNYRYALDPTVTPIVQNPNYSPFMLGVLVFIQVVYLTMVDGPIAAFLVELFPTRIRYTSMSLPYHLGNGVFGGLVPIIGLSLIAATKNDLAGLWYPMLIAGISFVIGALFLPETHTIDIAKDSAAEESIQPVLKEAA